jgi:hypothetical protein
MQRCQNKTSPGLTAVNVPLRASASLTGVPWNEESYPASMRRLAPPVRRKAIEIANALLEEGYEEGKSIRIAIAKAKEWAAQHAPPRRATHG